MMKIIYHHRTLGDGAEGIHIREMVNALRSLGHEVRIVSLVGEKTNTPTPPYKRWEIINRMMPSSIHELAEIAYNVVGRHKLLQAIHEFQPDFIYERYSSYNTAGLRAARRVRIPVFLEVNAPLVYERTAYKHQQLKFPWLARRYEQMICSSVDQVLVVSTPLKEHLVREIGVPAEKISVLHNGANPKTFHPTIDGSAVRQRYQISDCIVIGFVGILRPWHGVDMLIEAFAQLHTKYPELHLLIVGDGLIQNELKIQSHKQGVGSNVTFTGRLPHEEVRYHVAAMDIAVSPRATFYASPLKILEYMAMAKAVVAPDMENIRDLICHGQDGILFEPESVESLRCQIDKLLQSSELRASIGKAARHKIETQLNWQRNAQRVLSVYQQLISG